MLDERERSAIYAPDPDCDTAEHAQHDVSQGAKHQHDAAPFGPPAPNLGVHFVNMRFQAQADFHLDYPGVLMYRGLAPDDPVVGMLYLTRAQDAPAGFVAGVDS